MLAFFRARLAYLEKESARRSPAPRPPPPPCYHFRMPRLGEAADMNVRKYRFHWTYTGVIVGGYTLAFCIALTSRPFPGITNPFVLINAALIICMFSDLQFGTYCVFDRASFYRVSYFIFKQDIPVDRIREMRFEPTYIFGGSGKSLWIVGRDRNGTDTSIQMTDMAYTRGVLTDVVRTLLRANPNIQLDDSASPSPDIEVIFVEVKSGAARLNHNEHSLKDAIENKRVRWHEYRVPTPITHSSDPATEPAL